MSNQSDSSSRSGGCTRGRTQKIPIRCYCVQRKLMNDNHVFKWVDEAFKDEIQQLNYQVRVLE
ncbi:unnamed protein product [Brassica oleracea var. botrytis]|uniref:Uncharacterized protein n=1 Tax=Brassica oleracea TaxID=3712 RepID=A0A3P6FNJ7_BRAOL|nr:unnamed protein product [Brassica oleracea]